MGAEFAVGNRVRARGLAWDVIEVAPLGAQTLLRLRCAAGDLGGLEWDILHPAEPVELLRSDLRPDAAGSVGGMAAASSGVPAGTGTRVPRTCWWPNRAGCGSSLTSLCR